MTRAVEIMGAMIRAVDGGDYDKSCRESGGDAGYNESHRERGLGL